MCSGTVALQRMGMSAIYKLSGWLRLVCIFKFYLMATQGNRFRELKYRV